MSRFAKENRFFIERNSECRTTLQFADGSYQDTVGQVRTEWTFLTGLTIPVTFEVLEECCFEVVIGDSILWENNVFEDDAYFMFNYRSENQIYNLAPFGLVKNWQRKWSTFKDHITRSGTSIPRPSCPFLPTQLTQAR